jgi:hypothetical protein
MDMDGNKKLQLTGYDYNAVAGMGSWNFVCK